jgi:hypothetical protein
MEMRSVYSSHVSSIGYENGNLIVEWANGRTSEYSGVPENVAEEVMNAPSIGSALRNSIKGAYVHRYL